ncbi:Tubby-related protein 4 [Aphelenchoides bicaudatus]|nr:Tubby-related protein 4 [Aphelenchoides bicaudatus]
MRIFWESPCWSGSSIYPSTITYVTWMPHIQPLPLPVIPPQPNSTVTHFKDGKPSKTRGFLAIGTENGVLGITVTDTADPATLEEADISRRFNFNLRGHHSRIQRCAWNSTMIKLASCDENGIIYVWVPNEERWSVELVNDRGLKVRDFNWSHNGQAALILYEDNFVLIGSASGQRIWNNTFLQQVNCGAWAPTSKEFVLGLENGQIQIYNDQGSLITDRQVLQVPIQRLAFAPIEQNWTLAVVSSRDQILFLNSAYEVSLQSWQSSEPIRMVQWSSSGQMLAVVCKTGNIIILNNEGRLIHSFIPPLLFSEETTISFTWAHSDEVVVVAAGGSLAVGRVQPDVAPLNDLIAYQIWLRMGRTAREVQRLELPERLSNQVKQFDRHVVKCRIPSYERMTRFVCEPTFWRWCCTIVPRKNYQYVLCLEHMGGLIPILMGRQTNRVIPQFIISLPPASAYSVHAFSGAQLHRVGNRWDFAANGNPNLRVRNSAFTSDLEPIPPPSIDEPAPQEVGYSSTVGTEFANIDDEHVMTNPLAVQQKRNTVWRRSKRRIKKFVGKRLSPRTPKADRMLCHVRSNVWCTRFKITSPGIKDLPVNLAQVVYKTSVLHLQPRQMTISLCDLRPLTKTLSQEPLPQGPLPLNSALAVNWKHRSADSSPNQIRRIHADEIVDTEDEADLIANNNDQQVGQGVVSPMNQQEMLMNQMNQRYTTYAETRARLRERRPIQRVPVAIQQPQNAPTRQRARRSALRFFRRAAEDQHEHQPQQMAAARRPTPSAPETDRSGRQVRFGQQFERGIDTPDSASQTELLDNEKQLFRLVADEFEALSAALNEKVHTIFTDLTPKSSGTTSKTSVVQTALPLKQKPLNRREQFAAQRSATTLDLVSEPQNTLWQHRVESLDFIDDDAPTVSQPFRVRERPSSAIDCFSSSDREPLLSNEKSPTMPAKKTEKLDIKLVEKLAALASDLMGKNKSKTSEEKRLLLSAEVKEPTDFPMPTNVEQMREYFRYIARKTAQIEEALTANDIHGDLRHRVHRIKQILGETTHATDLLEPSRTFWMPAEVSRTLAVDPLEEMDGEIQSERGGSPTNEERPGMLPYDTIRMSNKTPFWNDESQVYQLDFGGRVTQESAKNFQIEFDEDQVMQFGRIENGAYTLDFCSPLSAVQAFGIALASITQRLK